jgi:hypothetical protein
MRRIVGMVLFSAWIAACGGEAIEVIGDAGSAGASQDPPTDSVWNGSWSGTYTAIGFFPEPISLTLADVGEESACGTGTVTSGTCTASGPVTCSNVTSQSISVSIALDLSQTPAMCGQAAPSLPTAFTFSVTLEDDGQHAGSSNTYFSANAGNGSITLTK